MSSRTRLAAIFVFVLGGLAGALAHRSGLHSRVLAAIQPEPAPDPARKLRGRFYPDRAKASAKDRAGPEDASVLDGLGYASGYEELESGDGLATSAVGDRAGWNLHTSGHAPEARLLDMAGRVVHTWRHVDTLASPEKQETQFWRRARLGSHGELYAIHDWWALYKLDVDSNLLWSYEGGCHHDLHLQEDGRVFVLGSEHRSAEVLEGRWVVDDFVVELSPDGEELQRISILDAISRSPWRAMLQRAPVGGDVLHTNQLRVLDGSLADRLPAFTAGRVLLSIRQLDALAVIDLEEEEIVWALTGPWHRQHDPTFLGDAGVLVFDNLGRGGDSRVLEYDLFDQVIGWTYPGPEGGDLSSPVMGAAQRLSDGNTLIVESTAGRVFEVEPDGRIIWEYRNPQRAGEQGEYIATIPDWVRLPADLPMDWLDARAKDGAADGAAGGAPR